MSIQYQDMYIGTDLYSNKTCMYINTAARYAGCSTGKGTGLYSTKKCRYMSVQYQDMQVHVYTLYSTKICRL